MNFKTKVAYSAVLATLGMAAGSAQAAFLSEDGTGQVLLYPYYTVQNGFDTYVSVVNTTGTAKAVKVRFIEGKASQEVLDFNLYLSAYDVWTGAVTTSTSGGARLVTNDTSCTAPAISGSVDFRNYQYTGSNDDPYENELSRTREGYIEMIEMGEITGNPTDATGKPFAWRITHVANKPNDCGWVTTQFLNGTAGTTMTPAIVAPTGGLIGSTTLINVAQGVDYSYDPVAIDSFMAVPNHTDPGSLNPSLNDATPVSVVIRRNGAVQEAVRTVWTTGRQAVSAILQHQAVMNEYTVETALNAGTDWVVTFPTKRFHLLTGAGGTWGVTAEQPFTKAPKSAILDTPTWLQWRACEPIRLTPYNREEQSTGTVDFSPLPPGGTSLCFESNVITMKNSKVLGSDNLQTNVANVFDNGWMRLSFLDAGHRLDAAAASTTVNGLTVGTGAATYFGLPAVGFAVQKYVNGSVGGVLSNYGGSFIHKYARNITTY